MKIQYYPFGAFFTDSTVSPSYSKATAEAKSPSSPSPSSSSSAATTLLRLLETVAVAVVDRRRLRGCGGGEGDASGTVPVDRVKQVDMWGTVGEGILAYNQVARCLRRIAEGQSVDWMDAGSWCSAYVARLGFGGVSGPTWHVGGVRGRLWGIAGGQWAEWTGAESRRSAYVARLGFGGVSGKWGGRVGAYRCVRGTFASGVGCRGSGGGVRGDGRSTVLRGRQQGAAGGPLTYLACPRAARFAYVAGRGCSRVFEGVRGPRWGSGGHWGGRQTAYVARWGCSRAIVGIAGAYVARWGRARGIAGGRWGTIDGGGDGWQGGGGWLAYVARLGFAGVDAGLVGVSWAQRGGCRLTCVFVGGRCGTSACGAFVVGRVGRGTGGARKPALNRRAGRGGVDWRRRVHGGCAYEGFGWGGGQATWWGKGSKPFTRLTCLPSKQGPACRYRINRDTFSARTRNSRGINSHASETAATGRTRRVPGTKHINFNIVRERTVGKM
ncbi:hypothetical protein GALMADRAFT_208559 [Galerina marginata CBS 339.88]|uniref:Uncharacterized protein n=1 Tax=Galerina marginata (strain CBS 339.88) TaxID=685588 RepID=A0A067TNG6_GALM3|nr:hypothetical protein GALMADRAFT_208559 [Galerina marginata CBS 339.88]